ncbi:MAG: SCP2 sterol-binding domain-containing protein [Spirochaetes bacterium]|nr:SCP2 sterol-binding domain-containing protein [Spirochaetota bacterium]
MAKQWKVESDQAIDAELRDRVLDKIEEGTLAMGDMKDFFTVFTQICNNTEDIQDEVERFDRVFLIKIDGQPFAWLEIRNLKFRMGSGDSEKPDITMEMNGKTAVEIFSGRTDATAAYMNGDLRVNGVINDAIQFRTILELVQEELE